MKRRIIPVFLLLCILCLPAAGLADVGFHSYFEGDPDSPQIAITVDDLYNLDDLEAMLDLCQTYDINMTFFALGAVIKEEDAAIWQRIVDEGNEIGNHTYTHKTVTDMTEYQLQRQLTRTQDALNAVLKEPYTLTLFRPPYGKYDRTGRTSTAILGDMGYHYIIMWSVDTTDPDEALKLTENGSILLFHTNKKDVDCLTTLIPELLKAGFEPVTVSQLLGLVPVPTEESKYLVE